MKVKCTNGKEIEFKETPYYYSVTVDSKTWYWNKDTGEFDGESFRLSSFPRNLETIY